MRLDRQDDGSYRCGDTSIVIKVHGHRRGETSLTFFDVDGKQLHSVLVKGDRRPITNEERRTNPHIKCTDVVTWTVLGPLFNRYFLPSSVLPGIKDANGFLEDFLRSYQWAGGWGCILDGQKHSALVEIVRAEASNGKV